MNVDVITLSRYIETLLLPAVMKHNTRLAFCLLLTIVTALMPSCSTRQRDTTPPIEIVEASFTEEADYWGLEFVAKNTGIEAIDFATFGVKIFNSSGEQINKSEEEFRFKAAVSGGDTILTRWTFNNSAVNDGFMWLKGVQYSSGANWVGKGARFKFEKVEN